MAKKSFLVKTAKAAALPITLIFDLIIIIVNFLKERKQ